MQRLFTFFVFCIFVTENIFSEIQPLPIDAKFIVSLISDDDGEFWIGSEDGGIFHYTNSGDVKHYTVTDGLGDNNGYALALDQQNRLWVGHLNTGVSVFNGNDWQNYDVLDALIGERVFAIQVCPVDGDVWIATSAGITRYKNKTDDWEDFTRADGLPEDQCSSLAFQKDGTLIVGTQCYGICIFTRDAGGNYRYDKTIDSPDRFGADGISPVPLVPAGKILPTNLINDVIVDAEDTVWIATSAGLVQADKTLKKFQYTRGKDYADKVRGLYGGAPKDWKECPSEVMQQLLPEDYVTTLALAGDGKLWLGFRQQGLMLFDPKTKERTLFGRNEKLPDNFVTTILSDAFGNVFAGTYGGGVAVIERGTAKVNVTKKKAPAPLPSKRKALTTKELRETFYRLQKIEQTKEPPKIITLHDDWRTRGDWIDRYGNYAAVLCAMAGGGFDFYTGYQKHQFDWAGWIGRNYKEKDDVLRRWVHWLESDDPRVLQSHRLGGRKQSEWDDHKETYPRTLDGPHVYGTFTLPPGEYIMSMYFFNKDGHSGANRYRDYTITVKTAKVPQDILDKLGKQGVNAERIFLRAPGGTKSRVKDFWGGVWKRFYVRVNPEDSVMVKIDASYSHNTIVSAVMFDPAVSMNLKPPGSLDPPPPEPRKPTDWANILEDVREDVWWRAKALDSILCLRDSDPTWYYTRSRQELLPLFRLFVAMKEGLPYAPKVLSGKLKERFRADVGTLAGDLQLFDIRDRISFLRGGKDEDGLKYQLFGWSVRSQLGRNKLDEWDWDWKKYRQFLKDNVGKQTW